MDRLNSGSCGHNVGGRIKFLALVHGTFALATSEAEAVPEVESSCIVAIRGFTTRQYKAKVSQIWASSMRGRASRQNEFRNRHEKRSEARLTATQI